MERNKRSIDGMILLQVEDSLGFGTQQLLDKEEKSSQIFRCKPRTPIDPNATAFNEVDIKHVRSQPTTKVSYIIYQSDKIEKLEEEGTQNHFTIQCSMAQYIGLNFRPDIWAPVQLVAPGKRLKTELDYKSLNKTTRFLKTTKNQGLNFVPLNLETTRLVLTTDTSFANSEHMKSQLGYVIMMVEDDENCNIIRYCSNRRKRVARSVMEAKNEALVLDFQYAFLVKQLTDELRFSSWFDHIYIPLYEEYYLNGFGQYVHN